MIYKKRSKAVVYYPIFLNIQGKKCVVAGGGKVALRKIKALLDHGANVTVISPRPHPDIAKMFKRKRIHLVQRDYKAGDLKAAAVALACTDTKEINRKVADEARKAGVLVNVADDPEQSDFIIPSSFRRGDLTVAVSTSGVSPALAKKIRSKLEKSFGAEYASLLSMVGEVRYAIKKKGYLVDTETWQEALNLDSLIRLIRKGQRERAKALLLGLLGFLR